MPDEYTTTHAIHANHLDRREVGEAIAGALVSADVPDDMFVYSASIKVSLDGRGRPKGRRISLKIWWRHWPPLLEAVSGEAREFADTGMP